MKSVSGRTIDAHAKISKLERRRTMTDEEKEICKKAQEMRLIQAEMSREFPCYIGSSLSITDVLAVLYFSVMKVDPEKPKDPDRDILVLSKGHASPALYAALHLRGYMPKKNLLLHSTLESPVYYHPSAKIPGIEVSTGSLGHGLNFGIGTALAQKQDGRKSRTFVIVGDGELNEGSNWEAIMSAPAFKLGNLVAIVDRNGLQANKRTEDLIPIENLKDKWESFGWRVAVVDGHDVGQLREVLKISGTPQSKPLVVIAKTVRNKGISFQEDQVDAWNLQLSEEDFQRACAEIRGGIRKSSKNAKSQSVVGFKE